MNTIYSKIKYTPMKQILLIIITLFGCSKIIAQDLTFTFANAQITNDGTDDYYDVDVMIQSTVDFKLGSGQLYLTYNTAAFGDNIHTNNALTYLQPAGSILAEQYGGFNAYKDFIKNDNTTSRVSLAFQQGLGSGSITANNVTSTPKVLLHVRIKFTNVNEDPMIAFETGAVYLDQFYTACGPAAGGLANCAEEPGVQLMNDTFDSSASPDTTAPIITLTGEDPQEITLGSGYSELGATTDDGSVVTINSSDFVDAIGSYTITYDATDIVGNVAAQVTRTVDVVAVLNTEEQDLDSFAIYPNPVTHNFTIQGMTKPIDKLRIFTLNGRLIRKIENIATNTSIAIHELPSGVYVVKLVSGINEYTAKLIKD